MSSSGDCRLCEAAALCFGGQVDGEAKPLEETTSKQYQKALKRTRRRRRRQEFVKSKRRRFVSWPAGILAATLVVFVLLLARRAVAEGAGRQEVAAAAQRAAEHTNGPTRVATLAARKKRHSGSLASAPCRDDCLAIPMVATLANGEQQVSGFLLQPAGAFLAAARRKRGENAKQRHHLAALARSPGGSANGPPLAHYHSAPTAAAAYAHSAHRKFAGHALAPHSDEKCPMTGALTVCDQIGSYPADVILGKLEIAKRTRPLFDIESFFSDERDHSAEPFREASPTLPNRRRGHSNTTTAAAAAAPRGANIDQQLRPASYRHYNEAAGQTRYAPVGHTMQAVNNYNERQPVSVSREFGNEAPTHLPSGDGAPPPPADAAPEGRRRANLAARAPRPDDADEFLLLVERQAIRLAPADAARGQRSAAAAAATAAQPAAAGRQTGRLDSGKTRPLSAAAQVLGSSSPDTAEVAASQPRLARAPLGSRKLAELRLAANRSTAAPSRLASAAGGRRREINGISAFVQANGVDLPEARAFSPSTATAAGNAARKQTSAAQRRARRQVQPPPPADASFGTGEENTNDAPNSNGEQVDPERVSAALEQGDELKPEPVCKAKSIYISPKAALNDKRQWKYVVNAPDRDPKVRQIIRVDVCKDPFGPCSSQIALPFGLASRCKQKYSKKKLLALNAETGLLEVDTFFIPSCCVCQLVQSEGGAELSAQTTPISTASDAGDDASED